ncbi:hypothetical protein Bbelb_297260 [Branchiostoma belcheri]|nr:hypothetical protein Bbelb_297260 [Branchiostoma belcheri]
MAAAPSLLKLGDEFLTWAEFKAALDNYQETTHAELSKISSKKVETENRKLPEGVQKFPCAHVYKAVKFGCINLREAAPVRVGNPAKSVSEELFGWLTALHQRYANREVPDTKYVACVLMPEAILYGLHKIKGISMEAAQQLMDKGPERSPEETWYRD